MMRPFTEYLAELNPKYEFHIRVAGCEAEQLKEKIESALAMYKVESVGSIKRLPIQEHSDFLGMGPCEVHMVEVALRYPTITDQVKHIVAEKLEVSARQVCVRTKREELLHENRPAEPIKAKDGSVLSNPDMETENAHDLVGTQRTESMLKELESRKYEIAAEGETAKTVDMPQGRLSPVGSTKINKPSIKGK